MVGGIALPGECPFCDYDPRSEIIAESESFFLVPSVGQITEGYVLLCTKEHLLGMSDLSNEQFIELENFLDKTIKALSQKYGRCIVWEHGSAGCAKQVGGCLNHAHFNIFPISSPVFSEISKEFEVKILDSYSDLTSARGSYIFLHDLDDKKYLLTLDGVTPSQYLRKIVAKKIGREELWDWRLHPGETEFINTINNLKPIMDKNHES